MKHRTAFVVALAATIGLLAYSSVLAEWGQCVGCPGMGMGKVLKALDDDQMKKARELKLEFFKHTEPARREIQALKIEVMELGLKDGDAGKIEEKLGEIWKLEDRLCKARRELMQDIRGLLHPEQKKKLFATGHGFGSRCGFGRHGRHGGGHGCRGRGMGPGCPGCPFARGGM